MKLPNAECDGCPPRWWFPTNGIGIANGGSKDDNGRYPKPNNPAARHYRRQHIRKLHRGRDACYLCADRTECLLAALRGHELWGVWGGWRPETRTKLRAKWLESFGAR